MRRRDALAILGLGLAACGPRRMGRRQNAGQPGPNGPQRVGAVPLSPVGGVSGPGPGPAGPGPAPRPGPTATSLARWREVLQQNRATQVRRLREYAARRMFPIYTGPDLNPHIRHRELTDSEPVFVDHRGVHCAVGYLMDRSGWSGAVDDIVRTNNFVYVEEVEDGPLIRWIEVSGLTQQEAAFIQPSYGWEPDPGAPRPIKRPVPKPVPDPVPPRKPPPPPSPDHMAAEVARLVAHFAEVEKQLLEDNELSLEEAMHRLRPRIEAGKPVGRLS